MEIIGKKEIGNRVLLKIRQLEAYREIQNLMGRAIISFNYRQREELLSYISQEKEDISIEVADEGVFCGSEAVKVYIDTYIPDAGIPGEMSDLHLAAPIIEVSGDGKTAKGQWVCPGIGALPKPKEDPQAIWNWGIIAADFICERNQWKIWHLHWFRLMKCDYELGWVKDTSMENRLNKPLNPLSKPSTYHNPYNRYTVRECIPAIPKPYQKYDGVDWMLSKDKTNGKLER